MARSRRAVFADESEEDSIATDSTAGSEQFEEYGVERVLLEKPDDEGAPQYLIKWEGYPMGRSNWEPADNILDSFILEQWEEEKRQIELGLKEPFDEDEWQQAVEDIDREKQARSQRRRAKRIKRGIPVSSDNQSEGEDDENDDTEQRESLFVDKRTHSEEAQSPRRRKRVKQPEVKRKGVAQKLNAARRKTTVEDSSSSDDEESEAGRSDGGSSDRDSLFDEIQANARPAQSRQSTARETRQKAEESNAERKRTRRVATKGVASEKGATIPPTSSRPAEKPRQTPHVQASSSKAAEAMPSRTAPVAASRTTAPTLPSTSTSSAPKAIRTRHPDKVMGNWDADKSRNRQPRVSGATPKDSADPKFHRLAVQNRFQKYSRNEPAPDPSALTMIDPKTGKGRVPSVAENSMNGKIHGAYGRRSPPREKSPEASTDVRTVQNPEPAIREEWETCWYWEQGKCKYTEETCRRAHRYTGLSAASKQLTCYYWKYRGFCTKRDENCQHARWDTGHYAPKPPDSMPSLEAEAPGQVDPASRLSDRMDVEPLPTSRADSEHRPANQFVPSRDITCYYWNRGRCKMGDNCRYAHHETGNLAPRPPDALHPLETPGQAVLPTIDGSRKDYGRMDVDPISKTELFLLDKKDITCYYWHEKGHCTKSDSECAFAHRDTGHYAGPPGSFKKVHRGSSLSSSVNTVPVANRVRVAPQSAGSPDPIPTDRQDLGWKQQTTMQTAKLDHGSPVDFVASPIARANASPSETASQTTQWNILGAAIQRRASAPNFSMKATLILSSQDDSQSQHVDVKLDIPDVPAFKRFAGSDPILRVEHMVTTSDFEHLLWNDKLGKTDSSAGGIFIDSAQVSVIENITEMCKAHATGLIARPEGCESKMIIYPGNAEEWRFLDNGLELSSECVLRFRLFNELPDLSEDVPRPLSVEERPPGQVLGEDLIKLDTEMLFPTKELKKNPVRAVFLMIPETHKAELAVFINYFAALKCRVYHSGQPGAWDFFRKKYCRSCTVIMHPDVQLWQIPGLYTFLSSFGAGLRIFSIGVNRTIALLEDREAEFGCQRLFPHGQVVFITDDTFIHEPGQATEVVKAMMQVMKGKPPGARFGRIAARPDILDWLFDLAMAKASDRGRKDDRWMQLYSTMCKLSRLDVDEDDLDGSEANPQYLVSLSPDLRPALDELREGGDEAAATDLEVDWFAGWSVLHASSFRKFVVCHEPPSSSDQGTSKARMEKDPRGWGKKYQHLGVMSAKDALYMLTNK